MEQLICSFVYHLREWYCDQYKISIDEFNENNNIDKIKFMKLVFFVCSSRGKDSYLLNNDDIIFKALPYGPLETNFNNYITNNTDIFKVGFGLKICDE